MFWRDIRADIQPNDGTGDWDTRCGDQSFNCGRAGRVNRSVLISVSDSVRRPQSREFIAISPLARADYSSRKWLPLGISALKHAIAGITYHALTPRKATVYQIRLLCIIIRILCRKVVRVGARAKFVPSFYTPG